MNNFMKLQEKSKVNLIDLIMQAREIQKRCVDYTLPGAYVGRRKKKEKTGCLNPGLTGATIMRNGKYGSLSFLAPISTGSDNVVSLNITAELTQWSLYQLCSVRLGIPHAYMLKCLESKQEDIQSLFEENINRYMSHCESAVKIRLYQPSGLCKPKIRGIVSDSYAVFDSYNVLKTVYEVLGNDFNIKGYSLDEEGLHLRMASPEQLDIDDEDVYPGFLITSGDVGNRSLNVQFFLWKQVCTNGLVVPKVSGRVLKKRHIGSYTPMDFRNGLTEVLEAFPVFCQNAKALIEEAKTVKLTDEMLTERLKGFVKEYKLKDTEKYQLEQRVSVYGLNLWGLVNALTEFAQDERFDLEDRLEIETYAGNMLTNELA